MKKIATMAVLLGLAGWTSACDWVADGQERLDALYGIPDISLDSGGSACQGCTCPDIQCATDANLDFDIDVTPGSLAGVWAVKVIQEGTMFQAMLNTRDVTTADIFLAMIIEGEETAQFRFCSEDTLVGPDPINIDGLDVSIEMPEETRAHLSDKTVLTWNIDTTTPTFPAQEQIMTFGLKEGFGKEDPLPTDESDPAVTDPDEDGNPGITISVDTLISGHRYMVKRAIFSFEAGTVSEDGMSITGDMAFVVNEQSLGADNPMLKEVVPIDPAETGSRYVFVRIPNDMDCAEIMQIQDSLFE